MSGAPIITSTWICESFTRLAVRMARGRVAGAERDVAGGVLVEQRDAVRAAGRADPRRRVDQRHLAEARPRRDRARGSREVGAVGFVVGADLDQPAARRTRPWMPSIRRPSSVSGRVQRKVPVVRRGSGLVKTSSVGMLARNRSPWMVVSSAAHHLPPRAMPTSSSVPGARSTSRSSAELVEPRRRAPTASRRGGPRRRPGRRPRRGRTTRGRAATWRVAAAGSSSGYTGAHQPFERDTRRRRTAARCAAPRAGRRAGPGMRDDRSRAARSGSAPFISFGADGPLIEMLAPCAGARSRSRCSAHGGW